MKVGMVSVYPPPASKNVKLSGVASYTKNLVASLTSDCKVVVFADRMSHTNDEYYEGAMVYRCWNKGVLYPFQIFKALAANSDLDVVHVQHEFFLYGGVFSAFLFPVLLVLIRLLGKPTVVTIHGVIPLSELNERFKEENALNGPLPLLRFGLVFMTKIIVFFSDCVIVHSRFFAETLYNEYRCPKWKNHVIPHGVGKVTVIIPQNEAKRKLGLENKVVIFFFGYIAKYKGIETLIEAFGRLAGKHRDWVLIIGGGEHPRLKTRAFYKRYVSELRDRAFSTRGQLRFTGFIPEEELATYFSAADLLVFPYTVTMSSSGPFALAISYGKTVIASNIPPFKEALPPSALFNKNDPKSLSERIKFILNHQFSKQDILAHVKEMRDASSWKQVGLQIRKLYQQILGGVNEK